MLLGRRFRRENTKTLQECFSRRLWPNHTNFFTSARYFKYFFSSSKDDFYNVVKHRFNKPVSLYVCVIVHTYEYLHAACKTNRRFWREISDIFAAAAGSKYCAPLRERIERISNNHLVLSIQPCFGNSELNGNEDHRSVGTTAIKLILAAILF